MFATVLGRNLNQKTGGDYFEKNYQFNHLHLHDAVACTGHGTGGG